MNSEIRDLMRAQSISASIDVDLQTVSSRDVLFDRSRNSSFTSQNSSRTSISTLRDQKRTNSCSYIHEIYEEFKLTAEDSQPKYLSVPLKRVKGSITHQLLHKIDLKPTIQLVALSASGQRVVLLSPYSFWVFRTLSGNIISSRVSPREKKTSRFGRRSKDTQLPDLQFLCAALSDKYLAIGVHDMIMVFSIEEGSQTERPVFSAKFESTNPERLKFDLSGEQLAAVFRDTGQDRTRVLIYSTASFSEEKLSGDVEDDEDDDPNFEPFEKSWNNSPYDPNDLTFSSDGSMLAICSSPSGSCTEVRILRKFKEGWRVLLTKEVELFGKNDKVGLGFTRITLYVFVYY